MRRELVVGILREENERERRAPLTPDDVQWLVELGIKVEVVSSPERVFKDSQYRAAGASVVKKIKKANFLVGIKAPKPGNVLANKAYMVFSHTIKGQKDNIYLLNEMIRKGVTLVDYEKIKDNRGKRIVFFGRFAGICGIVDSLHFYGKRMQKKGIFTPFQGLKPSWKYSNLEKMKEDVAKAGELIATRGFSKRVSPFIIGIVGRGNVSAGVQEILGLMNTVEIHPGDMRRFIRSKKHSSKELYSIVFYREEKLRSKDKKKFYFEEYLEHPDGFESNMDKYLSQLNILVNAGYWDVHYPRIITRKMVRDLYGRKNFRMEFISDISCDIEGSVELTHRTTNQKKPIYTYDPFKDSYKDGYSSKGISILAIDNLPTELPADASENFSGLIREYVYQIAAHGAKDIVNHVAIPHELRQATVVQDCKLTDNYQYLREYIR
ncbi:hypothetical protein ACFL4E_02670 [Candidatus Omnitrophota bacterium]